MTREERLWAMAEKWQESDYRPKDERALGAYIARQECGKALEAALREPLEEPTAEEVERAAREIARVECDEPSDGEFANCAAYATCPCRRRAAEILRAARSRP